MVDALLFQLDKYASHRVSYDAGIFMNGVFTEDDKVFASLCVGQALDG
jgi:hypothetical protein